MEFAVGIRILWIMGRSFIRWPEQGDGLWQWTTARLWSPVAATPHARETSQ